MAGRGYGHCKQTAAASPFVYTDFPVSVSTGKGRVYRSVPSEPSNGFIVGYNKPADQSESSILRDYFSKAKPGNDTMISVQGREIWVPRGMLIWLAPKFSQKMTPIDLDFDPNQSQMGQNRFFMIKITEKPFDHVFEMIKCLFPCPSQSKIDLKNVTFLLPMAVEYEIVSLKKGCEDFLKSCPFSAENWCQNLLLAKNFDLHGVFKTYLTKSACLKYDILKKHYSDLPLPLIGLILDAKLGALHKFYALNNTLNHSTLHHATLNTLNNTSNGLNFERCHNSASFSEGVQSANGNNNNSALYNNHASFSTNQINSSGRSSGHSSMSGGNVSGQDIVGNFVHNKDIVGNCTICGLPPNQKDDPVFEPFCACFVSIDELLLAKSKIYY